MIVINRNQPLRLSRHNIQAHDWKAYHFGFDAVVAFTLALGVHLLALARIPGRVKTSLGLDRVAAPAIAQPAAVAAD